MYTEFSENYKPAELVKLKCKISRKVGSAYIWGEKAARKARNIK